MRRFCSIVLMVLLLMGCAQDAPPLPRETYAAYHPAEIHVVASNAPGWARRRATAWPNVYICNGTNDEEEIQEAIDAAQAFGSSAEYAPTVVLSPGLFYIEAPIKVGYAEDAAGYSQPNQNRGCSLVGSGRMKTEIRWAGDEVDDLGADNWMVHFSPSSSSRQPEIRGLFLYGNNGRAGGAIYSTGLNYGGISDVAIYSVKYVGVYCDDSWLARHRNISVTGSDGGAAYFDDCTQGGIEGLVVNNMTGEHVPNIKSYRPDTATNFYIFETVTTAAGETGIVLGTTPGRIVVHHTVDDDFDDGDVITGASSELTATIDADGGAVGEEVYDLRCGVYITGLLTRVENLHFEDVIYTTDTIDYPMLLIQGTGTAVESLQFHEGSSGYARKGANVVIQVKDADQCTVRNVSAVAGYVQIRSLGCTVVGAVITVTDGLEIEDELSVGDTLYLWDTVGAGVTEAVYTIAAGGIDDAANTITVTAAPGNSADARMYCIEHATDSYPSAVVVLENSIGTIVENIRLRSYRAAGVVVDDECENTTVTNVRDWGAELYAGSEDNWSHVPHPMSLVLDYGTATTILSPRTYDETDLIYGGPFHPKGQWEQAAPPPPTSPEPESSYGTILQILGDVRGFWPFLERSGTTVNDYTFNNHDLTPSEDVSDWDLPARHWGSVYVYSFNGTDEELDTPDDGDFTTAGVFSVGAWVYMHDSTDSTILAKWDVDGDNREWKLYLDDNDYPSLEVFDESGDDIVGREDQTALSENAWHFVVATFDGGTDASGINVYVDGVDVDDMNVADDVGFADMEDKDAAVDIGFEEDASSDPVNYFDGLMWGPFFTQKELSAVEVWNLYQIGRGLLNQ